MLKLAASSVELLRAKHKNCETYYRVLYYTYLSPQKSISTMDIIETLRPHLKFIYHRTYYRFRDKAIEALGNLLWGFRA